MAQQSWYVLMRPAITERQGVYLRAIVSLTQAAGYAPSLRELGEACGVGGPGARSAMLTLLRRGLVRMDPATARSLRLTDLGRAALTQEESNGEARV